MNIFDFIAGNVIQIVAGAVISGIIFKFLWDLKNKLLDKFQAILHQRLIEIQDPNLRNMAKSAVLYAAQKFQDGTNDEKFKAAKMALIKQVQDAIPNFILSDDKVEILIESALKEVKDRVVLSTI